MYIYKYPISSKEFANNSLFCFYFPKKKKGDELKICRV